MSKGFILMRWFHIWSQSWGGIIFYPYFGRKTAQKSLKSRSWSILTVFRPRHESNIIQAQIWDHIWNPLINTKLVDPNMKEKLKIYFLTSHSIFKISPLVSESKSKFYGRKWHCFIIHIPWHGISSENLEKVEFGEKWNALLGTEGVRLNAGNV